MHTLWAHWQIVADRSRAADAALDSLVARYREPHRRYHGERHLVHVVSDIARFGDDLAPAQHRIVSAAAFFHDAVYDPRSGSNETDSAALASLVLGGLGWSEPDRADVTRLIEATRTHEVTDEPSAVLLDADLAVLGADPAAYADYVRGVRAEYGFVDDKGWRVGRTQVLQSFLGRAAIFHTDLGRTLESRARANLTAECSALVR